MVTEVKEKKKSNTLLIVLGVILGVLILGMFGAIFDSDSKSSLTGDVVNEQSGSEEVIVLNSKDQNTKSNDDENNKALVETKETTEEISEEVKACTPNWNCGSWSECSSSRTQTRTCTDFNHCDILINKPKESQSCIYFSKTKSATIKIDRVQTLLANLYPIRITVTNTGDLTIYPKFDLYVYDDQNKEVCSGSPLFDEFHSLSSGEGKTGEITMLGCSFNEDGDYILQVDLLDSDYKNLDSDTKGFSINYWAEFEF